MSDSGSQAKKPKPGFTNPAFKAMGIPPLKLPSRNWMIFWSVLTVSVSGIVYDKHRQKQIRNHYKDIVEPLASGNLEVNTKPRKITVFIAPPPSDYLDTSLKVWKRYVKPILYYAGLDYEVIEEEKQGVIRTEVANRIREVRKQLRELASGKQDGENAQRLASQDEDEFDPELAKKYKSEFDFRDAIGIFYKTSKPQIIYEDSQNPDPSLAGGIICLGRGAYKEYITGLHEGLLGPLDPPASVEPKVEETQLEEPKVENMQGTDLKVENAQGEDLKENVQDEKEGEKDDKEEETKDEKVLKPFITSDNYSEADIPQELQFQRGLFIKDPLTGIPILPHQAILMIPIPNLIGFLNIPERIYRFYQKRFYAEAVCSAVTDVVEQKNIRPYHSPQDLALGAEEEEDWPKSWVKEGLKRKSEWTAELKDDPRVTELLTVYNKGKEEPEK